MMKPDEQLRTEFNQAGFIGQVSKGMYYRTGEDVNDGFGNFIPSCREYISSRTHRNSEVKLWIQNYTEIGTVGDVKVTCLHGRHGIEFHIPPTFGDTNKVWVVISRGPNRYVEELRHRDPDNSLEEADYESMQDTGQEQPTIQLNMSDECQ